MMPTAVISPPLSPVFQFSPKSPSSASGRRSQSGPPPICNSATAYREKSRVSMPPKMPSSSLYEILGIQSGATSQEIKSAYRKLARTCHPDVAAIDRKDNSADEFMRIHAAYTTLSDPERRVVYDRKQLFRRMRPLTTAGLSGYSGRSWETDQCW
ncbi:Chaperone protein dnaJ 11, chloroplastic [Linum grandiflorum]